MRSRADGPRAVPRQTGRVAVFAIGHPDRGDDAVAAEAVRDLDPKVRARADIAVVSALDVETLVELPPDAPVVVVDGVAGVAPGRVIEIELADLATLARGATPTSSHALPLDAVVELAGMMRGRPLHGRFVGLGLADVSPDGSLSRAVAKGLPRFRRAIAASIDAVDTPRDETAHR